MSVRSRQRAQGSTQVACAADQPFDLAMRVFPDRIRPGQQRATGRRQSKTPTTAVFLIDRNLQEPPPFERQGVSVDDGQLRPANSRDRDGVHEQRFGLRYERLDRLAHRLKTRPQDVAFVDLGRLDVADPDRHRVAPHLARDPFSRRVSLGQYVDINVFNVRQDLNTVVLVSEKVMKSAKMRGSSMQVQRRLNSTRRL